MLKKAKLFSVQVVSAFYDAYVLKEFATNKSVKLFPSSLLLFNLPVTFLSISKFSVYVMFGATPAPIQFEIILEVCSMFSKITMALPCKCLIKCLHHLFEIFIGEFIQFAYV